MRKKIDCLFPGFDIVGLEDYEQAKSVIKYFDASLFLQDGGPNLDPQHDTTLTINLSNYEHNLYV